MVPIRLFCQCCGKSMEYERSIDPSIPSEVVRITQPHCDECWNGECEEETWWDADGRRVAQTAEPLNTP